MEVPFHEPTAAVLSPVASPLNIFRGWFRERICRAQFSAALPLKSAVKAFTAQSFSPPCCSSNAGDRCSADGELIVGQQRATAEGRIQFGIRREVAGGGRDDIGLVVDCTFFTYTPTAPPL